MAEVRSTPDGWYEVWVIGGEREDRALVRTRDYESAIMCVNHHNVRKQENVDG
jgi:hypothetical protein